MLTLVPDGSYERTARLALSLLAEPGDPRVADDVRRRGPVAVLDTWSTQIAAGEDAGYRSGDCVAARETAERLLESPQPAGPRWVCPGDAEWPGGLDDLDEVAPVQRRGGAPLGLWVHGPRQLAAVVTRSVALVGSRASTTYGSQVAGDLAAESAGRDISVVSGAAHGIDSAAHRGALAVDGVTVAVLACGVDVAYPRGHESLLRRIAEDGVVASELPPGATPTRLRFLSRNRIIAALATGTVVVEAALRSGSLNTANWAGGLGRTVMGVPGPVTSSTSAGVHRLIRDGGAELVTSGTDIAESIAPLGSDTATWVEGEHRLVDDLQGADRVVLEALTVGVARSAVEVAAAARLNVEVTEPALGRLLLAGLAERTGDGWRLSRQAPLALRSH